MAGPLKNARQEKFCQERLKGKSLGDAYKAAGFKPNDKNAARLAKVPHVAERLTELQERVADRVVITAADIARQLDEDRAFAREKKQAAAAVSATMGKAKVLGLIVNQHSGPGGGPIPVQWNFDGISDKELEQLERIASKIAAPGSHPGGTGAAEG